MARAAEADRLSRVQIRVEGTVQGVGFRPYVYGLAEELELSGWVLNDAHGVLLEIEGARELIDAFTARLAAGAPPLARIDRVAADARTPTGEQGFEIRASIDDGAAATPISPDAATCEDCLAELRTPSDRRHRYPFINCTNCGPRWTIVLSVPYDRPATTMSAFTMCAACQAEYDDPLDRRFHAQPNACPDCGPCLKFDGLTGEAALRAALSAIERGRIVAVKGLGGFHLACRADCEDAVAMLRARKQREEKPFALMAADLEAARELVELGPAAQAALLHSARPIVVAPRLADDAHVARSVAPASRELGVMLPYTPLHHLLLEGGSLVMTSANVSDEPIAFEDEDALERLGGIADDFLLHDRRIHMRTDDSVLRAPPGAASPMVLRRSRGYVPQALELPVASSRPLLACGAELKSTFCLVKGRRAWVSHHIGDLGNYETLCSFEQGIEHMKRLFAVQPELAVHDLHPDYLSTRHALQFDRTLAVQHHHAHLAAVLAEHGECGPAVGAIYDGAGYGTDGTVWGGELLVGDLDGFERSGHLLAVGLPGGDRAAREPWRMACAWLELLGEGRSGVAPEVSEERWSAVASLSRAATRTSSVGRLFDAVAALCGVRSVVSYEGQAAIELEALADPLEHGAYPLGADLDPREMLAAVARDVRREVATALIAARFHNALGAATAVACRQLAERAGVRVVVLAGGCFQNSLLLERTREGLQGLRCLTALELPAGDGAIAFGQAAIGAAAQAADTSPKFAR